MGQTQLYIIEKKYGGHFADWQPLSGMRPQFAEHLAREKLEAYQEKKENQRGRGLARYVEYRIAIYEFKEAVPEKKAKPNKKARKKAR